MDIGTESVRHGGVRLSAYHSPCPAPKGSVLLVHGFGSNAQTNWLSTQWVQSLNRAAFDVILWDHRGHGASEKLYRAQDYDLEVMAKDGFALADHFGVERFDLIGYSMGARVGAVMAARGAERVRRLVLAGLGEALFTGQSAALTEAIARVLVADPPDHGTPASVLNYRRFAEQTRSDTKALAACIQARHRVARGDLARIAQPTLVVIGDQDEIAGEINPLLDLLPNARGVTLAGKDHMRAVGDKAFKRQAIDFLSADPKAVREAGSAEGSR